MSNLGTPASCNTRNTVDVSTAGGTALASRCYLAFQSREKTSRKKTCQRLPEKTILSASQLEVWRKRASIVCTSSSSSQQVETSFRVSIDKDEFKAGNVAFGRAQDGRNFAIVISKVTPGSASEQEGLKKGQKLLSISSPMQSGAAGEMWPVNERPSLRFVQDAVRMTRVPEVTLELTREAMLRGASISEDPKTTLLDSMEESMQRQNGSTIADKLVQAQKENEESAYRDKAQRDRRIQRRKEYMDREATRDNSKFFVGLAASIFLPAIGILVYAFSSGLLDRIGDSYRPY